MPLQYAILFDILTPGHKKQYKGSLSRLDMYYSYVRQHITSAPYVSEQIDPILFKIFECITFLFSI